MKKFLSVFLALAMMLSLAACGGGGGKASDPPAGGNDTPGSSAPADPSGEAQFPTMQLSVSCSTNEVETPSRVLKVFMDYVTEHTGGAVTFNVFYGGTFCAAPEELYQLQSGALDMCILQTLAYGDVLPLFVSCPQMWVGSDEDAYNYFQTLFVDDPVTGALIKEELSAFNVSMVGLIYTGLNCWFSSKTFNSFEDLEGLKIACQDSAPIDGLGLTAQFVDVGDLYDSLDRGVVDAGTFSFDGTVALKLYEPAKNVMLDQGKTWGMPFCMREDLWNSLSPELQTIFKEAMAVAADFSVETVNANIEAAKTNLASEGVTIGMLSDEDAAASFEAQLVASIANGMRRAEAAGKKDKMLQIESKALSLYGLDEDTYLGQYK